MDNRTFPCYYPGQELRVRLLSQGWLHVGSLSCPSCTELCQVRLLTAATYESAYLSLFRALKQETFMAANSSCKLPMPDPRVGQIYPNDPLDCGSLRPAHSVALSVIFFVALQLLTWFRVSFLSHWITQLRTYSIKNLNITNCPISIRSRFFIFCICIFFLSRPLTSLHRQRIVCK